jgi:hypothetical protein
MNNIHHTCNTTHLRINHALMSHCPYQIADENSLYSVFSSFHITILLSLTPLCKVPLFSKILDTAFISHTVISKKKKKHEIRYSILSMFCALKKEKRK